MFGYVSAYMLNNGDNVGEYVEYMYGVSYGHA